MTDMTGLENGSFSYVVTNHGTGCCSWVSKLLPVTAVLAVQTAKPAAKA